MRLEEIWLKWGNLLGLALASSLIISSIFPTGDVYALKGSDKVEGYQKIQQQKQDLLDQIEKLDSDLKTYVDQIRNAQNKIAAIQKDVEKVQLKLKQAEDKEKYYQDAYNKRIRFLYEKGEMYFMSTLMEAKSFSQFLARLEFVRSVAKSDYALLKKQKEARQEVEKQLEEYNKLIMDQDKLLRDAEKSYQQLKDQLVSKNKDLEKLDQLAEDYESEIIQINRDLISSGRLHFAFKGPLLKPMNAPISSGFGMRYHPKLHIYRMHEGVDFAAPVGTPYRAAADGVVVESRPSNGYGWIITIYHGEKNGKGIYTRYAHSYPSEVKVRVGQEVKAGEIISAVGNAGLSTGPHLHFEVRIGSSPTSAVPVDPVKYFGY
jgi:murein DD-endopeptidase MepM/ murein hydrolase activator NlpD